jgi:hypothetical protein
MRWHIRGLLFVLIAGSCCSALAAAPSGDPSITAQGFAMDTTHSAAAGQFEQVRVRIEAPERIEKLLISQDAFEADLATTPDRSLFALFGLDKRPLSAFDVTLDFAPFMNHRLAEPGSYRIDIVVIDRKGGRSRASLSVAVIGDKADEDAPPREAERSPPFEQSEAVFRRQGSGHVESDGFSGLDWFTIEPINVTIRLRAIESGATLHRLSASNWGAAITRDHLATIIADTPSLDYVDIPTARGQAAGTLIALGGNGDDVLIRVTGSITSVSSVGTTVMLTASVRR